MTSMIIYYYFHVNKEITPNLRTPQSIEHSVDQMKKKTIKTYDHFFQCENSITYENKSKTSTRK